MMFAVIENGQLGGFLSDTADAPEGAMTWPCPPGLDPAEGWVWDGGGLIRDPQRLLADAKAERLRTVKTWAAGEIAKLQWRIERAQERDRLGLPGETVEEVLLEREAIRRASNRIEAEIEAAQDVAAVQAVQFAVTEADRATPSRITRLQFLLRFTDAEMQAIVAAAESNAALKAALLKWQTAEGIVLTDPATIAGVQALEIAGLIAPGRAEAILTPPITI